MPASAATVSLPELVIAQAKKLPVVIGRLSAGQRPAAGRDILAEFKKEFALLGWQEGANYVLE